jgi:RNA polymerase sigma-70 factor (ECF subfamily)
MNEPKASFAAFYESERHRVFRAVLMATRQPERSEDAVSQAFTAAFERWDRVGTHPNPTAWVIRSALNAFRSGWRIWRREFPELGDVIAIAPEPAGIESDLLSLLWRLPARQRQVVALRIVADLDTKQTAAILGIAPGTVTAHLHRALHSLRQAMRGTEYEELAR